MREYKCPKCNSISVNILISILTEQPAQYFRKLPNTIEITPETSPVSAMVDWSKAKYICGECRYISENVLNFL